MAIDGSDLPAYANGQRFLSKNGPEREKFCDPDASWGHRSAVSTRKGGGFLGYEVHAAVCAITGLPLAWTVETARDAETTFALPLIDATKARGFAVKTAIMGKGYDNEPIHTGYMERGSFRSRHFARLPLSSVATTSRARATTGSGPSRAPTSSARLRSGDALRASARPASLWVKTDRLHPLIPRTTERSRKLYCSRGAVEREFGRLKREWAMPPLLVRGLDRVRLPDDPGQADDRAWEGEGAGVPLAA